MESLCQFHWEGDSPGLGTEVFIIYLSVTVFTINAICVLPNIIIGSSDFHNYDSYTVVFDISIKAASANHDYWSFCPQAWDGLQEEQ